MLFFFRTLLVLPALYAIWGDRGKRSKNIDTIEPGAAETDPS